MISLAGVPPDRRVLGQDPDLPRGDRARRRPRDLARRGDAGELGDQHLLLLHGPAADDLQGPRARRARCACPCWSRPSSVCDARRSFVIFVIPNPFAEIADLRCSDRSVGGGSERAVRGTNRCRSSYRTACESIVLDGSATRGTSSEGSERTVTPGINRAEDLGPDRGPRAGCSCWSARLLRRSGRCSSSLLLGLGFNFAMYWFSGKIAIRTTQSQAGDRGGVPAAVPDRARAGPERRHADARDLRLGHDAAERLRHRTEPASTRRSP